MRPHIFEEPNGNRTILIAIINPKFTSARNFLLTACEAFMFLRAKNILTNTIKVKPLAENEGSLLCDKIEVGYFVSTDLFFGNNTSCLTTGYGRDSCNCRY